MITPRRTLAIAPETPSVGPGYLKGMNVPASFYASPELLRLVSKELSTAGGGFAGAVQQLANVATLPGQCGCLLNSKCACPLTHGVKHLVTCYRHCWILNWHARHSQWV